MDQKPKYSFTLDQSVSDIRNPEIKLLVEQTIEECYKSSFTALSHKVVYQLTFDRYILSVRGYNSTTETIIFVDIAKKWGSDEVWFVPTQNMVCFQFTSESELKKPQDTITREARLAYFKESDKIDWNEPDKINTPLDIGDRKTVRFVFSLLMSQLKCKLINCNIEVFDVNDTSFKLLVGKITESPDLNTLHNCFNDKHNCEKVVCCFSKNGIIINIKRNRKRKRDETEDLGENDIL